MFARSFWAREVLGELDRLHRSTAASVDGYEGQFGARVPALNAAATDTAVNVQLMVPGVDPATLDVQIEQGVLSISGERAATEVPSGSAGSLHARERFSGAFRRSVRLPQDANADDVKADYRDGILHVRIGRSGPPPARRISVQ